MEMDKSILLELRPLVDVSHHLPGRLRLRLRPGGALRNLVKGQTTFEIQDLSSLLPGLLAVESNTLSGSLLIRYDPRLLPYSDIDLFFRTESILTAAEILARLLPVDHSNKEKNP